VIRDMTSRPVRHARIDSAFNSARHNGVTAFSG
jgi:hypothetical protein